MARRGRSGARSFLAEAMLLAAIFSGACGGKDSASAPAQRRPAALITGATESAEYRYDGAGNLLQVRDQPAVAVSVAGFAPSRGGAGQIVTVTGSGFSPAPAVNVVRLNGVAAAVLVATYSELTFAVPAGAATGRISVTVGAGTATSASDFTVVTGVEVADFTPKVGRAGTILTVTGSNFAATPAGNTVQVGGGSATPTAASSTTLMATVGAGATSGKVKVTAGGTTGTSAADFYLLPTGATPLDVAFTSRAQPGVPVTAAIGTPGKIGLAVFDGVQGRGQTISIGGNTFPGSTALTVFAPSGATLLAQSLSYGTAYKLDLGFLAATGTYAISIRPTAASTGKLDLTVFEDAGVSLTIDGPAAAISVAAGQNGAYTFTGAVGDVFSFAATTLSTVPASTAVTFTFYKPDGTVLYTYAWNAPTALNQLPAPLPAAGTYRLRVVPTGVTSASVTVILSRPLAGILATNGTVTRFDSARPGQTGSYTFAGTAGQGWTLRATASATFAGKVYVYAPSGAQLAYASLSASSDAKLDPGLLPATGTCKVQVTPTGLATGAVDLRLVAEAVGSMTIGAGAKTIPLTAAQNGRYSFAGSQGDLLSLVVSALSTVPSGTSVTFSILRPDGTAHFTGSATAPATWSVASLPVAGTYTLRVLPGGVAAATVGAELRRR